jgi:hypothetical protein
MEATFLHSDSRKNSSSMSCNVTTEALLPWVARRLLRANLLGLVIWRDGLCKALVWGVQCYRPGGIRLKPIYPATHRLVRRGRAMHSMFVPLWPRDNMLGECASAEHWQTRSAANSLCLRGLIGLRIRARMNQHHASVRSTRQRSPERANKSRTG